MLGKRERGCAPDAVARAGDDCDLAGELHRTILRDGVTSAGSGGCADDMPTAGFGDANAVIHEEKKKN
jgi:hypothetical protein